MKRFSILCGLCALLACIPDFGLEDREFDSPDGGDAALDAQANSTDAAVKAEICNNGVDDDDNGVRDCKDPACGEASCDDDNVCTVDSCSQAGDCIRSNDNTISGQGWRCAQGNKVETTCADGVDNDVDGFPDCTDSDCPECALMLLCCPSSGACLPVCD